MQQLELELDLDLEMEMELQMEQANSEQCDDARTSRTGRGPVEQPRSKGDHRINLVLMQVQVEVERHCDGEESWRRTGSNITSPPIASHLLNVLRETTTTTTTSTANGSHTTSPTTRTSSSPIFLPCVLEQQARRRICPSIV